MPKCNEIARLIAADELEFAPWTRRLLVRLHLLMCRHCRNYASQLGSIAAAARELVDDGPDKSRRQKLEASIIEHIGDSEDSSKS